MAAQRGRIEALTGEQPEKSGWLITHWTAREIAAELKKRKISSEISPRHAARLLNKSGNKAASESPLADAGL